jgi:hypothetical protein
VYFVKKKEAELNRAKQQAAIISAVQMTIGGRQSIWTVKQI